MIQANDQHMHTSADIHIKPETFNCPPQTLSPNHCTLRESATKRTLSATNQANDKDVNGEKDSSEGVDVLIGATFEFARNV